MSILRLDTIQDQAGGNASTPDEIYSGRAKAWVNFNGTTGSGVGFSDMTIRASFNVSSITDNGTGDYTVNFSTALADADYAINLSSAFSTTGGDQPCTYPSTNTAPTSLAVRVNVMQGGPANGAYFADKARISVAIFR